MEKFKFSTIGYIIEMKSIKISDKTYVELLKLKARLTSYNGKARTFDEAVQELLKAYNEKMVEEV